MSLVHSSLNAPGNSGPLKAGEGGRCGGATQPQSGEKRQGEATMLEREREREREGGELISYESDKHESLNFGKKSCKCG